MIEAMAAGCVIIGSATAPVQEVIEDGRNGLLVDFFSPKGIADRVDEVLSHPDRMRQLGEIARRDIMQHFNVKDKLGEYEALWKSLIPAERVTSLSRRP